MAASWAVSLSLAFSDASRIAAVNSVWKSRVSPNSDKWILDSASRAISCMSLVLGRTLGVDSRV